MDLKKLGKALLFPHVAIMLLLLPAATVLLVGSMVFVGTDSVIAYISYALSAYTLTVWCFKIPKIIKYFKTFKDENKYARRWLEDPRLRVKVSLYGSFAWNALYGIFQLWLGFYHHTFWFYSLGAYYICLGVMRFFLARHTTRYAPGERMQAELRKYRACGIVFLVMNLALALIIFFMVYWGRTFEHHMITAIAMAAYTFTALTTAILNVIKYRKYNSPVFSASKAISLAAALVSMLTLESTMLTTFGDGTMTATAQKWMLGATGGAISVLIVATAIYMIVVGTKKLKQ
ncbi:MAG: hypothetical protein IIV17_05195 [Clostridia bacterium]|nr:hypothetical protein [Clostridia bacterium]MBQ5662420.1 hypothetical protein [Clostridia bacterium]